MPCPPTTTASSAPERLAPKGPRKNKTLFSSGSDSVIPFGQGVVLGDGQLMHLCVGDFDTLLVASANEMCPHPQSGGGRCGANVFEDRVEAVKRTSGAVLGEFAEQPMLDWIPLGCSGRVMGDGHSEPMALAELVVESELPDPASGAVTAAAVGEDGEALDIGIAFAALGAPPLLDTVDCEPRGVGGGGGDEHGAGVGLQVVDTVGNCHGLGVGVEVVVVDEHGLAIPLRAGVFERPHEFLLLGVDADHRCVLGGSAFTQVSDAGELGVTVGMRGAGEFLVVDAQRETHLLEQCSHRTVADLDAEVV